MKWPSPCAKALTRPDPTQATQPHNAEWQLISQTNDELLLKPINQTNIALPQQSGAAERVFDRAYNYIIDDDDDGSYRDRFFLCLFCVPFASRAAKRIYDGIERRVWLEFRITMLSIICSHKKRPRTNVLCALVHGILRTYNIRARYARLYCENACAAIEKFQMSKFAHNAQFKRSQHARKRLSENRLNEHNLLLTFCMFSVFFFFFYQSGNAP